MEGVKDLMVFMICVLAMIPAGIIISRTLNKLKLKAGLENMTDCTSVGIKPTALIRTENKGKIIDASYVEIDSGPV